MVVRGVEVRAAEPLATTLKTCKRGSYEGGSSSSLSSSAQHVAGRRYEKSSGGRNGFAVDAGATGAEVADTEELSAAADATLVGTAAARWVERIRAMRSVGADVSGTEPDAARSSSSSSAPSSPADPADALSIGLTPSAVRRQRVRLRLQQQPRHRKLPLVGRQPQRRVALFVRGSHVRPQAK